MKFSFAVLALVSAASAASTSFQGNVHIPHSILKLIKNLIPDEMKDSVIKFLKSIEDPLKLLEQGKCAVPIIGGQINKLPCNGKGPLSTICANIEDIKE